MFAMAPGIEAAMDTRTIRSVNLLVQNLTFGKSGVPSGGGESTPSFDDAAADSGYLSEPYVAFTRRHLMRLTRSKLIMVIKGYKPQPEGYLHEIC